MTQTQLTDEPYNIRLTTEQEAFFNKNNLISKSNFIREAVDEKILKTQIIKNK